jgi:hypothetical protein
MRYFLAFVLLLTASASFAQSLAPPSIDSSVHSSQTVHRPLPPSILAELRRSQKSRTLVYQDTLHATDLMREHFNDSVSRDYSDSAISVIDTAVSLSHKEWLDSELIEIPELARLGSHVHYHYPQSLMMETDFRTVDFDSTLLDQMNPVTRENLPFFDQSPIPMPMQAQKNSESFLEAGGGNVALPRIAGWLAQTLSERSAMSISGEYQSFDASQSAVHNYGNILATLSTELGDDPASEVYRAQDLKVQAGYAEKSIATNNISTNDRTLSQFSGIASMDGDFSKIFHYDARFEDHELTDGLSTGTTESSQDVTLETRLDLSNVRVIVDGNYSLASLFADTSGDANSFGSGSIPIHAESAKALIGERDIENIEWYVGAEYLGGSGEDGSNCSALMPVLRGRMQLNSDLSIGASFEPQGQLASLRELTSTNPFYAPELILQSKQNGTLLSAPVDGRSVVMDKINLAAFMNYTLSPDDELRFEARYITRNNEPIFNAVTTKDSTILFIATPESTERFELTVAGSFLVFSRDVFSGSAQYCSAIISGTGQAIPFEPNVKLAAEYHFNSIWDSVQPSLAFQMISRSGQTFTFIDVNVDAQLSHAVAVTGHIENILGGASDFWPGFPEKPRSIWATVRYTF